MLEILLYLLVGLVVLHLLVGFSVYCYACHLDEKSLQEAKQAEKDRARQALDNRIEAMRQEKLAAYYRNQARYAPTTVMPLVPPPPQKKP
jgi:hypothetical protein